MHQHVRETNIVQHHGVFQRQITLFEAVALIVSGTVGAGVLALPYAVSKVGIALGLLYIVVLGLVIMGLNLLVGELAACNKDNMQIAGFADKYLGKPFKWFMAFLVYTAMFGSLLVYTIGEGTTLSTLFGGSAFMWSMIFFGVMAIPIILGMRTIKVVEFVLTIAIIAIIMIIAAWSMPHVELIHVNYHNLAYIFFPYGVVLYSFSGASTIPEAHSILVRRDTDFKKAIIYSSSIVIIMYCLFAFMTVGVLGADTTEIATIGLGQKLGPLMLVVGNVFAALSMGTCFLMGGLAMRDSMSWDFKMPPQWANVLVLGLPLIAFLLGLRQFIVALDFIGGVVISTELLLILAIYWRAKQKGDLEKGKYRLHHSLLLVMALLLAFSIGAVYSVVKLF